MGTDVAVVQLTKTHQMANGVNNSTVNHAHIVFGIVGSVVDNGGSSDVNCVSSVVVDWKTYKN